MSIEYVCRRSTLATVCLAVAFYVCVATAILSQTHRASRSNNADIRRRIDKIIRQQLSAGTFEFNGIRTQTETPPNPEDVNEIRVYGDRALPFLSTHLKSTNTRERAVTIKFLGLLGGLRVIPPLQRVIEYDPSPDIRILALRWISQESPQFALPVIRKAANVDVDPCVRKEAMRILGKPSNERCPQVSVPFKVVTSPQVLAPFKVAPTP